MQRKSGSVKQSPNCPTLIETNLLTRITSSPSWVWMCPIEAGVNPDCRFRGENDDEIPNWKVSSNANIQTWYKHITGEKNLEASKNALERTKVHSGSI